MRLISAGFWFICCLSVLDCVSGMGPVTTANCGGGATIGRRHTLTCYIHTTLEDGIQWFRRNVNIITCDNTRHCVSNDVLLYNVSTEQQPMRTQQFEIISVKQDDFTEPWSCVYTGSLHSDQSSCVLQVAADTVADCGGPVAEGDPAVLTCNITGSITNGFSWFREGDRKSIITCDGTSKSCISSNETLYSVNSTAHPDNKQQFTINSVSADDLTKKWICIDGTTYPDPTTAGTSCTLTKPTTTPAGSDEGGLSGGAIAGIVIGVLVVVIGGVVVGVCVICYKNKKRNGTTP